MNRMLIAYYSYSNSTRNLADEIGRQTGGDVRALVPQKAYSFGHNTAAKEVRGEISRGHCPVLSSGNEPIDGYTTIFVGSPNWFKSLAPPVLSFLRGHDFSGKTIVPFCTHGGGGFGEIEMRIARECPGAKVLPGFAASGDVTVEEITGWLTGLNIPPLVSPPSNS